MKVIIRMLFLAAIVAAGNTTYASKAVLVCHYGSSDSVTRSKTIDLITREIRDAMPGYEVREAYISPVVRRSMEKQGVHKDSPTDALLKLRAEGYDTVYVQSTTLIDGVEMAEVRGACGSLSEFFSLIKCGESLCYTPDDCQALVNILASEPYGKDEAVVYVGHGNMLPATATYCQLDYMLMAGGYDNCHVSTIEGYPTAVSTVAELRKNKKIKNVRLVPLLLVCGNHTRNDISGDFADAIEAAGYETETVMRGLGEVAAVRALYVERLKRLVDESARSR